MPFQNQKAIVQFAFRSVSVAIINLLNVCIVHVKGSFKAAMGVLHLGRPCFFVIQQNRHRDFAIGTNKSLIVIHLFKL